jgi:hypothetical protein
MVVGPTDEARDCSCESPTASETINHALIVPAVVLSHFPYARGRASETLVCAICLEALRDGEACSEVPGCRHVFHGDCVGAWVRSKGSCPLCRTKIAPASGGAADDMRPVRLAYQPPASTTFPSEQTSYQQPILFSQNKPASSTLLSEQTSTRHQTTEQADGVAN